MYSDMIRESVAKAGAMGQYDARHIEAFMRLEHPALDGLSRSQFDAEVRLSMACIDECGRDEAEAIARSFGY